MALRMGLSQRLLVWSGFGIVKLKLLAICFVRFSSRWYRAGSWVSDHTTFSGQETMKEMQSLSHTIQLLQRQVMEAESLFEPWKLRDEAAW